MSNPPRLIDPKQAVADAAKLGLIKTAIEHLAEKKRDTAAKAEAAAKAGIKPAATDKSQAISDRNREGRRYIRVHPKPPLVPVTKHGQPLFIIAPQ